MTSSKPDYAKWSLVLGGGSLLVGLGYWWGSGDSFGVIGGAIQ